MRMTNAQWHQIEVSGHWNAHNHELCDCSEPPERCPGECGEVYPFGVLRGLPCGDCGDPDVLKAEHARREAANG